MTPTRNESCEARIGAEMADTLATLRRVWAANQGEPQEPEYDDEGDENPEYDDSLDGESAFHEFGLAFDYVVPDTFDDQDEGYFRYQICWGGPSEEFRFYATPGRFGYTPHRVEFCFMDWGDGASRTLHGSDRELLDEVFEWFNSIDEMAGILAEA